MKNYYFTFGTSHYMNDGLCLADYWVKVIADSYGKARQLFIEQFTTVYMSSADKWSFQYEEKNWDPSYFPGGELTAITQSVEA